MSELENITMSEKLVIGYLVTGNSVYDLVKKLTEYMKKDGSISRLVDDIKSGIVDQEDPTEYRQYLLTAYDNVESLKNQIIEGA